MNVPRKAIIPSILLVLAQFGVPSAQADIINGGFETYPGPFFANPGTPVSDGFWTFANHAGVEFDRGNPGKAVRLESNGNVSWDPTISQTVFGLTPGVTYTIAWDLALRVNVGGAGSGRTFGVFLDTQTFDSGLFFGEHLSLDYVSQSVDFVATSSSHTLIFAGELDNRTNGSVGNTDVSYFIDNIAMTGDPAPVPEPSSFALLAVGLLAVGTVWRHKRVGASARQG